jgi:hypothetical protein
MKKTKIKQRFSNAADAFFANEDLNDNNLIGFSNDSNILRNEHSADLPSKADVAFKIFKQVFLFLPGTLLLFFLTIVFTGFLVLRPPIFAESNVAYGLSVMLVSALMTFFGLGDWRKLEHFSIPLSIIILGTVLGFAGSLLFGLERFIFFVDRYVIYFFPLALIVPFLAKGWVHEKNRRQNFD